MENLVLHGPAVNRADCRVSILLRRLRVRRGLQIMEEYPVSADPPHRRRARGCPLALSHVPICSPSIVWNNYIREIVNRRRVSMAERVWKR